MKDTIILSIGYNCFAIEGKAPIEGKLLELLSNAVSVRRNYQMVSGTETYRIEPHDLEVKVEMIDRRNLLPPSVEDMAKSGAVQLNTLPGAMRLLKGGGA